MKKILFCLIVLFVAGCAKWETLAPNADGVLTVRVENFVISFVYGSPDTLEIYNQNWESGWVNIARQETWSSYFDIFDQDVPGRTFVSEVVFFEKGDKIQIRIDIEDSDGENQTEYSYFRLGKVIREGYTDEAETETIEFHREGKWLVADITL